MTTALMNNLNAKGARFAGVMITLVGALLMSLDPIFIRFSGVSGVDTAFLFGLFTARCQYLSNFAMSAVWFER